jgi:acetolactate synthase small subunit
MTEKKCILTRLVGNEPGVTARVSGLFASRGYNIETFSGRIVDTGTTHFIIEVTGRQEKINAVIRLLEPMGIAKPARSGILALYHEPE